MDRKPDICFYINDNQIRYVSERSYLVSLPHSSDYDGYRFWISKKLVFSDYVEADRYLVDVWDGFVFRLFKSIKKQDGTWETTDETELDAVDVSEYYEQADKEYAESYYRVTNPEKREEVVVDVIDEFRNV